MKGRINSIAVHNWCLVAIACLLAGSGWLIAADSGAPGGNDATTNTHGRGSGPPTPPPPSFLQKEFDLYLAAAEDFNKDGVMGGDREKRLADFHKLWRERLTKSLVSGAQADDPFIYQVLSELRSIDLALGDFDASRTIAHDLVKRAPNADHKGRALVSIVSIDQLMTDKDVSSLPKEAAIEDIDAALSFVKDQPKTIDPATLADLFDVIGDLYGRYNDPKDAIGSYIEASDGIIAAGKDGSLGPMNADVVLLKAFKFDVREDGGKNKDDLVRRLMAVNGGAYEKGYRMLEVARTLDPSEGPDFLKMIEDYAAKEPPDSWTPYLVKQLGEGYYDLKDYTKALDFMTRFLSTDFKQFKPHNPELPDPKLFIKDALKSFSLCLHMLGDKGSQDDVNNVLAQLDQRWKDFEKPAAGTPSKP